MLAPCPICSSTDVSHRFTISAEDATQVWRLKEQEPAAHDALRANIEELWGSDTAHMTRCETCDLEFISPFRAGDAAYYDLAFGESGYPKEKWEFARSLEAIGDRLGAETEVLELGAGVGHFVDKLVERGVLAANVSFTEYNDSAINILQTKGMKLVHDEQLARDIADDSYDLIFLFQVLEHRDNVRELLGTLARVLRPGGNILLAVPNRLRIRYHEQNGSFIDVPPAHISWWSQKAMAEVARRSGLDLLEWENEPFNLGEFVRQDLQFSFMRRAQSKGSLAHHAYPRRKHPAWRLVTFGLAGLNGAVRAPIWLRSRRSFPVLGASSWARLGKRAS